jgi:hypothetical protein
VERVGRPALIAKGLPPARHFASPLRAAALGGFCGVQRRRKIFRKNTIDLQWKMRAKYNARLCASLRKAVSARTMGNNEKNNAQSNRNSRKSRRVLTFRLDAGSQAAACESPPSGMRQSGGMRAIGRMRSWRPNKKPA